LVFFAFYNYCFEFSGNMKVSASLLSAFSLGFLYATETSPSNPQIMGCWEELSKLPHGPRQEHSVTSVGNNIYLIGGMIHGPAIPTAASTSIEVFNTSSYQWSDAASLPIPMHHPNVATVDNKIYVLGGMAFKDGNWASVGNSYQYDPVTNRWSELAPMPVGTGRGSAVVGVLGNMVFLAGGIQIPRPGADRIAISSVQSYDTVSGKWNPEGKWKQLPDINDSPEGRDHAGGAVINGTFYVVGGRVGAREKVRGTVYAINLLEAFPKWGSKASMPTARGGIAVAAYENNIYTFGGEGNPAPGTKGVFPSTEVYDVTTDSWKSLAPMKMPRHGTQAVTVGQKIYLPGGGGQQGFGLDTDYFDVLKFWQSC
jgi:N-acetylneuraminic acid mutarotase